MADKEHDPIEREVKDAFRYVADKLGLGRTVDFMYEETSDNVQLAIMRAANEKEAPNEWYIEFNPTEILGSMEKQEHSMPEYVKSLALHEILHLIAWDLAKLGAKGLSRSDKKRLAEMEEAMVRNLESLLRPLVVRCRCKHRGKSKKSEPISTQLSSTGPSLPIGSTPQNTNAPNPHATSSSILEGSSTERKETTTGEEFPNVIDSAREGNAKLGERLP